MAQLVKNLPAMWEIWVQSLGWEDPLEEGMEIHSSILAWRMPWTEEPGGLQSMRSQRVRQDWATSLSLLHCWWECKLVWLLCRTLWRFLKNLKTELPCDPAIPFPSIYPDKTIILKDPCTPMFTAVLFTIAKTGRLPKCSEREEWIKKTWCTVEY